MNGYNSVSELKVDRMSQPQEANTHEISQQFSSRHFQTDHLLNDLAERTARAGVVTLGVQGVKFFAGIVVTMVLGRLLTPQDYGLIGMVAVVMGFVSIFKDAGLAAATVQQSQ